MVPMLPKDFTLTGGDKDVIASFIYEQLKSAIEKHREALRSENTIEAAAWRTRNLLELLIWVEYCAQSKENSLNLFHEAIRDVEDVNKKGVPSDKIDTSVVQQVADLADAIEMERRNIASISLIADKVGKKDFYSQQNKICSKYVHPTPMSIIAPLSVEAAKRVSEMYTAAGEEFAKSALAKLDESLLLELHNKYKESRDTVLAQFKSGLHSIPPPDSPPA